MSQPLIIGAGHNGLITAFYLARAGLKPLVLEARSMVGGAAVTEEIAPGYRCPTLAHAIGPLRPSIVRDMQLARRVEFSRPDPRLVALSPDGRALVFSTDVARTAEAIRRHSATDADALSRVLRDARAARRASPAAARDERRPSLDGPPPREMWELLKTGRRFRALGRTDGFRLLRWMPMAVADLVAEWFTSDLLQAAVAARGIFGAAAGPMVRRAPARRCS